MCMCVHTCVMLHMYTVLKWVKREVLICNRAVGHYQPKMWVLETRCGSSGRAASLPNHWSISPSLLCTLNFTFIGLSVHYWFVWFGPEDFKWGTLRRLEPWGLHSDVTLVPFSLCRGDVRKWGSPVIHTLSPEISSRATMLPRPQLTKSFKL